MLSCSPNRQNERTSGTEHSPSLVLKITIKHVQEQVHVTTMNVTPTAGDELVRCSKEGNGIGMLVKLEQWVVVSSYKML